MSRATRSLIATLAAALAAVIGCDSANPSGAGGPTGAIAISLSGSALTVVQGASAITTVTLTRTNFTGDVTLSAEGTPEGMTVTFAPAMLSAGTTQSTVTLAASGSASVMSATITIRATGTGTPDQTATLGVTVTAAPPVTFSISLSGSALTVAQGASASATLTLTRTNFASDVTLSAEGAPAGVTVTFAPATLSGGTTQSTVTLAASGSASATSATITIRATGTGASDQTTTLGVTVTVAPTPTLSIAPMHATLTAAQQGSASTVVLISRGGSLSGNVALSASGLPTGVTATFSPASTAEGFTDLSFMATSGTAPGTYTVTVSASGTGVPSVNTTLSLTVIAPPPKSPLTMPFCSSSVPTWAAYRNDGYAWVQLTPASNAITFDATQKVEVALVWESTSATVTRVFFATRAELSHWGTVTRCRGTKTLTGTFTGLASGESVGIRMGAATVTINASASTPYFTLGDVRDGPVDLIAVRRSSTGTNKVIVRRALSLASGSAIPTLDFNAEGHVPVLASITLNEVPEYTYVDQWLTTSSTDMYLGGPDATSTTFPLFWMPAGQLLAGELHQVDIETYGADDPFFNGRGVLAGYTTAADRNISLGPLVSEAAFTLVGRSPYFRLRGRLPSQSEYPSVAWISYSDQPLDAAIMGRRLLADVIGTVGYFGGRPAVWDMAIPNFSGLGFNSFWLPPRFGGYEAEVMSGRPELLWSAAWVDGDAQRWSFRYGDGRDPMTASGGRHPIAASSERMEMLRHRARSPVFEPK